MVAEALAVAIGVGALSAFPVAMAVKMVLTWIEEPETSRRTMFSLMYLWLIVWYFIILHFTWTLAR